MWGGGVSAVTVFSSSLWFVWHVRGGSAVTVFPSSVCFVWPVRGGSAVTVFSSGWPQLQVNMERFNQTKNDNSKYKGWQVPVAHGLQNNLPPWPESRPETSLTSLHETHMLHSTDCHTMHTAFYLLPWCHLHIFFNVHLSFHWLIWLII